MNGNGGAGGIVGGGTGGNGTEGICIDLSLEAETRRIMSVMGGDQPHDSEWEFLFFRAPEGFTGGVGPSCRSVMADKMMAAYRVAASLSKDTAT